MSAYVAIKLTYPSDPGFGIGGISGSDTIPGDDLGVGASRYMARSIFITFSFLMFESMFDHSRVVSTRSFPSLRIAGSCHTISVTGDTMEFIIKYEITSKQ